MPRQLRVRVVAVQVAAWAVVVWGVLPDKDGSLHSPRSPAWAHPAKLSAPARQAKKAKKKKSKKAE